MGIENQRPNGLEGESIRATNAASWGKAVVRRLAVEGQIQPQIAEYPHKLPLWPTDAFAQAVPGSVNALLALEQQVWKGMQDIGRGKLPGN